MFVGPKQNLIWCCQKMNSNTRTDFQRAPAPTGFNPSRVTLEGHAPSCPRYKYSSVVKRILLTGESFRKKLNSRLLHFHTIVLLTVFLFLTVFFCNPVCSEDKIGSLRKNASEDLLEVRQRYQNFISSRIKGRKEILSSLTSLRARVRKLEKEQDDLLNKLHLFQEERSRIAVRYRDQEKEKKEFQREFMSALVEHNMNRKLSFLGTAGLIKEYSSHNVRNYFSEMAKEVKLSAEKTSP